jgi:hypothetical protein
MDVALECVSDEPPKEDHSELVEITKAKVS